MRVVLIALLFAALTVAVLAITQKPPVAPLTDEQCSRCTWVSCSVMSARIRNKLVELDCDFHPIFTALYSFHCGFFAGEPGQEAQEQCTQAIGDLTCGDDGLVTLDDLPAQCTTDIGLPTDTRW